MSGETEDRGSAAETERFEEPDGTTYVVSAEGEVTPGPPISEYTEAHAAESLVRAAQMVGVFAVAGVLIAWWRGGWQSGVLLLVGAAISASGLWEWKRLMTALMARMDGAEGRSREEGLHEVKRPSIGFAVAGFAVRLLVVGVVLYVSLKYLHGSVLALAAGLAMGVVALTIQGLKLLRSGTI